MGEVDGEMEGEATRTGVLDRVVVWVAGVCGETPRRQSHGEPYWLQHKFVLPAKTTHIIMIMIYIVMMMMMMLMMMMMMMTMMMKIMIIITIIQQSTNLILRRPSRRPGSVRRVGLDARSRPCWQPASQ